MVGLYFDLCRGHSNDSGHSEVSVSVFPNVDHNEVHRRVEPQGPNNEAKNGSHPPPPPVRMQALPGGSDAAWTVLVYRATDPRSRFEMLME